MDTAIPFPPAAELDLDDIPYVEGMSISCFPPAAEHMEDPFWYDTLHDSIAPPTHCT